MKVMKFVTVLAATAYSVVADPRGIRSTDDHSLEGVGVKGGGGLGLEGSPAFPMILSRKHGIHVEDGIGVNDGKDLRQDGGGTLVAELEDPEVVAGSDCNDPLGNLTNAISCIKEVADVVTVSLGAVHDVFTKGADLYNEPTFEKFGALMQSGSGIVKALVPAPFGSILGTGISIFGSFFGGGKAEEDATEEDQRLTNEQIMNKTEELFNKVNKRLDGIDETLKEGFNNVMNSLADLTVLMEYNLVIVENVKKEMWIDPFERVHSAYTNLMNTYLPKDETESWDPFFDKAVRIRHELDREVYDSFELKNVKEFLVWFAKAEVNDMGMCGQATQFQFVNAVRFELLQICLFGSFEREDKTCDGHNTSCWHPGTTMQAKYLEAYMNQMDDWNFHILNAQRLGGLGIGSLVSKSRASLKEGVRGTNGALGFCFQCKGTNELGCETPFSLSSDGQEQCNSHECCSCSCDPHYASDDRHCEGGEDVYYSEALLDKFIVPETTPPSDGNCRLVSRNNFAKQTPEWDPYDKEDAEMDQDSDCNTVCSDVSISQDSFCAEACKANTDADECIKCNQCVSCVAVKSEEHTCSTFCLPYVDANLEGIGVTSLDDNKFSCSCFFKDNQVPDVDTDENVENDNCDGDSATGPTLRKQVISATNLRASANDHASLMEYTTQRKDYYKPKNLVSRVDIKSPDKPLNIGEVQVFDPSGYDVAFMKTTRQAGEVLEGHPASRAVDGNGATGSKTNIGTNSWWEVDFLNAVSVESVRIRPFSNDFENLLGIVISLYTPHDGSMVYTISGADMDPLSTDGNGELVIDILFDAFETGTSTFRPTPSPTRSPTKRPSREVCRQTGCNSDVCASDERETNSASCFNWLFYNDRRCCKIVYT